MTGYGAARADAPTAHVQVEVRGVNQRFLDVKLVVPREYAVFEGELRDCIRRHVERGRVDVSVTRVPVARRRRYTVAIRHELARAYVDAGRRLARDLGLAGALEIGDVLRVPDLLEITEASPAVAQERRAVDRALVGALRAFDRERRREGAVLRRELVSRTQRLGALARAIAARRPAVIAAFTTRVTERVAKLGGLPDYEPARLLQEVAGLAERSDITEEIVRLEAHLAALRKVLGTTGAVGKRIEFLLQEIQRELNTTGAKAADVTIGGLVVDGKAEVEKLREQVQNIE